MLPNSIRSKLFLTFGSLSACICVLFAGLSWLFVVVTEDDVLKRVLDNEGLYIQQQFAETQQLVKPRADYFALYPTTSDLPQNVYQGYLSNPYEKEFYIGERNIHIEEYKLSHETSFWLTIDASKLEVVGELTGLMAWMLALASSIVLVFALLAARVLSHRTAKPIEQLTQKVTAHDKQNKFVFESRGQNDEIDQLGHAFEQAFGNLATLLKREVNFSRDVSHELRTPITLLQNTLSLAGDEPLSDRDKLLIRQVAKELQNTVEVLLALARSENLMLEEFAIKPVLERSVLATHHANPDSEFKVVLSVNSGKKVRCNPSLFSLLCQNLINNGFYHGGNGEMRIYCNDNTLVFENSLGAQINDSYQGLGHGQYLVRRIVELMCWSMQVTADEHVYRVILTM